MSLKASRVINSRSKFTAPPVDDDSDYEGESVKAFPPLKQLNIKNTNGEDDGVVEENPVMIRNHRGKYKFDELFNKLNIRTPLPHAANTYARVLEYNMRRFGSSLEYIAELIKKSRRFYISIRLMDIESMPSDTGHGDFETFINLLGFHGYRVTRDDKGTKYELNTLINIICIPADK